MDIQKPILQPSSLVGLNCKNTLSKDDLWKSLLAPHFTENALETSSEDMALQGISLLLGTTFFHFKDIYSQLLSTRNELETLRHDWQSTLQSCEKLKNQLKKAQSNCTNCAKLQKDLNAALERSNNFQSVLLNAIKTLNPPNGSKPQSDSQTKRACNMMTQALQGTQDISPLDEIEDSPLADFWRSTSQKRSLEAMSSPNEILATPDNEPIPKKSFRLHHRTVADKKVPAPVLVVPDSLIDEENSVPSPVKSSGAAHGERRVLSDVSLNVQTTPKKGIVKVNDGSPILGNSHKKMGKGSAEAHNDSPALSIICDSPLVTRKRQETQDLPSPSLLNSEQFQDCKATGIKGPLAVLKSSGSNDSPEGPSKVIKLESTNSDVSFECRPSGNGLRKMKQQKLSLSSFQRAKQDISTFKEFNGGVRAQPSDLGVEMMDEDQQLERALQESLLEDERRKKEEEGISRFLRPDMSDATFYCPPVINVDDNDNDDDDDDDDVIAATPQRAIKHAEKLPVMDKNTICKTLTEGFKPTVTSTMMPTDFTVDAFAPDLFSTAISAVDTSCTPNANLDALVEELEVERKENLRSMSQPKRLDTSFDRLPPRVKTSPNYKYKMDPVRKKCDRQKMPGHSGQCCKDFYTENGADPNKISKHRDHYGFQKSTPPGYWDPSFPHSTQGKQ